MEQDRELHRARMNAAQADSTINELLSALKSIASIENETIDYAKELASSAIYFHELTVKEQAHIKKLEEESK